MTNNARAFAADAGQVLGPVTFVRPTEITPELSRLLGFLAAAKRPMRLFQKLEPARKWILAVKLSAD